MGNYLLYGAVIATLAGLGFGALYLRGPDLQNYPPREGPIVAFGDSLVSGIGAGAGEDFVSLISARLGKRVINLGVPGDTTADALERLEEVNALQPAVVLVLLGGNDYLRRMPAQETFENLRTIIETLQADGALVVLLGVRGGVLRDNFRESFEVLARETSAAYVPDVLDGILGNSELMADQVHPNSAGHARIAEKVYATLEPLLP
jgi:acyl-CoA thioesterase I